MRHLRFFIIFALLFLAGCAGEQVSYSPQERLGTYPSSASGAAKGDTWEYKYVGDAVDVGAGPGWAYNLPLYAGVPFSPSPMEVKRGSELREPLKIRIVSYNKGLLIPTKDSPVPVAFILRPGSYEGEIMPVTYAINVMWEFVEAGISFETEDAKYVSEKPGATINFTKGGVKMEGVKKVLRSLLHKVSLGVPLVYM